MAKTYRLECGELCSLGPGTKWGIRVTEALLENVPYRVIVATAAKEGDKLFPGTISRHKKHIVVTGRDKDEDKAVSVAYRAGNVEILETIIQKGFQNSRNWKPTISDTMKAMDMWFRITQGNPFDELLNTLASAAIGEEAPPETNPQAIHAVGESDMPMFEDEEEEELVAPGG